MLLIVLDGMSWAVCHELLDDIRREHWFLATLDESITPPQPVIATIPSVTGFSRASLLSGKVAKRRCGEREAELRVEPAPGACLRQEVSPGALPQEGGHPRGTWSRGR